MTALRTLLAQAIARLRRNQQESRLADEIATHLDLLTDEYRQRGLSDAQARTAARRKFGGVAQMKEDVRAKGGFAWFDARRADLRYAVRGLRKNPFVALIAILSLSCGIGANVAIFSLFHQILLQTLPVPEPHRLVNFSSPGPRQGNESCDFVGSCDRVFTYPMFRDLQQSQSSFTGIAAFVLRKANVSYATLTQSGFAMFVSGSYFPVLGRQPALGRLIEPSDELQQPGDARVVVLSYGYWRSRLNQSPAVLNQTLIVNGRPLTIVGVSPEGFTGTIVGTMPDVFVPLSMYGARSPDSPLTQRRNYFLSLTARLRPGTAINDASAAINVPYRSILKTVEAPLQRMNAQTLTQFSSRPLRLEPGERGQGEVRDHQRVPLTLLIGVAGLVLLIASANVANLLLARGATRSSEMAIRLSLGGSRRRLMAQLLTESSLLAVLGGSLSLLVANWTLGLIDAVIRPTLAPVELAGIRYSLNTPAMLFAVALTLGVGLLFGLVPLVHSSRTDLVSVLKGAAAQVGDSRAASRLRWSLATSQIALSLALLVLAGLFTKSLFNASRTDLGFQTNDLVTFSVSPRTSGYGLEESRALYKRIEERLSALPGVTSITSSNVGLFGGDTIAQQWETGVRVEGYPFGLDIDTNARYALVGAGYFRTLGIPLIAGRDVAPFDGERTPRVAIVNEKFVEKFKLGDRAIGTRIATYGAPLDTQIVGVARNAKYSELFGQIQPEFFLPYRQRLEVTDNTFYVRSAGNPARIVAAIPSLLAGVGSNVPVENLRTMSEQLQSYATVNRVTGVLSTAFASLATLLAASGLYGVLAYTVAQRTKEFGLRMALGASRARVQYMLLKQVAGMIAVGGLSGLAIALALGRFSESLLYQLKVLDPLVLSMSCLLIVVIAFGAGLAPAYRASRLDPLKALRYE